MNDDMLGAAIEELIFDDAAIISLGAFVATMTVAGFLIIRRLIRR